MMTRKRYKGPGRCLSLLLIACLPLAGCNLPEHVEITNETDQTLYVQLVLPYPAYEMLDNHTRYDVQVRPGGSWSTDCASSDDRADVEIAGPNSLALLRLYQFGRAGWSAFAINPAAELFEVDPVRVTVNVSADDTFIITAEDDRGAAVEVLPIDDADWFSRP